jgi:hypothetical protein
MFREPPPLPPIGEFVFPSVSLLSPLRSFQNIFPSTVLSALNVDDPSCCYPSYFPIFFYKLKKMNSNPTVRIVKASGSNLSEINKGNIDVSKKEKHKKDKSRHKKKARVLDEKDDVELVDGYTDSESLESFSDSGSGK